MKISIKGRGKVPGREKEGEALDGKWGTRARKYLVYFSPCHGPCEVLSPLSVQMLNSTAPSPAPGPMADITNALQHQLEGAPRTPAWGLIRISTAIK